MTCLKLVRPASGAEPAVLTLPQPLTAQAMLEFEHAVAGTLAMSGRDYSSAGPGLLTAHAVSRSDAADIEYASWIPDPGGREVASWARNLRTSLR